MFGMSKQPFRPPLRRGFDSASFLLTMQIPFFHVPNKYLIMNKPVCIDWIERLAELQYIKFWEGGGT
jgi:hypothetical protein